MLGDHVLTLCLLVHLQEAESQTAEPAEHTAAVLEGAIQSVTSLLLCMCFGSWYALPEPGGCFFFFGCTTVTGGGRHGAALLIRRPREISEFHTGQRKLLNYTQAQCE